MAILKTQEGEKEVNDGASVIEACEELGVPFGCTNGVCGTCRVEIVSGSEHLNDQTEAEEAMGLEGKERLMCQCTIKEGTVEIRY